MSAAVLARGLSEQWKAVTVTAVSVGAMLLLGLWVYQDLDLSIYDALPEAARALMGIPAGADPSLMAYNEMLAAVGALAFTGVSVSLGSRAVAADEAAGRASLVLATPTSRAASSCTTSTTPASSKTNTPAGSRERTTRTSSACTTAATNCCTG